MTIEQALRVLNLNENFKIAELKNSYKKKLRENHPDLIRFNKHLSKTEAKFNTQKIIEAYEILVNYSIIKNTTSKKDILLNLVNEKFNFNPNLNVNYLKNYSNYCIHIMKIRDKIANLILKNSITESEIMDYYNNILEDIFNLTINEYLFKLDLSKNIDCLNLYSKQLELLKTDCSCVGEFCEQFENLLKIYFEKYCIDIKSIKEDYKYDFSTYKGVLINFLKKKEVDIIENKLLLDGLLNLSNLPKFKEEFDSFNASFMIENDNISYFLEHLNSILHKKYNYDLHNSNVLFAVIDAIETFLDEYSSITYKNIMDNHLLIEKCFDHYLKEKLSLLNEEQKVKYMN